MKKTYGILCAGENPLLSQLVGKAPIPLSGDSLRQTLEQAAAAGATEFLVAMDGDGGLRAAETLLELKRQYPALRLSCLMRWEEQAVHWPEPLRDRWFDAFAACDREILLEHRPSADNLRRCVDYLRQNSQELLLFREADEAQSV